MEKKNIQKVKYIAGGLLFLSLCLLAASFYIKEKQSDYVGEIRVRIAEQETKLAVLSELADRDGEDEVVKQIVQDCDLESRERFDTLLGKLSQLARPELLEIKNLFDLCGSYYAERKAVVVSRLVRENEVYNDYIMLLSLVDNKQKAVQGEETVWSKLVELEVERSLLSKELVDIQGLIIDALLSNSPVTSPKMQDMLKEAQTARDSLNYLNNTIDVLRKDAINVSV